MAGYTAIANLETGASVRGKINTQNTELFAENGKSFITVADAAALAAVPAAYKSAGKLILQLDTGIIYRWTGAAFAEWTTGDLELAAVDAGIGRFGDIAGGDYSEFEPTGTYKANGGALTWSDLIVPATNLRPGGTPPAFAAFNNGIWGFRFDAGSSDELHGAVELQHDYKEGTDLYFHVHWSPTTTNTGNIVWGCEYSVAKIGNTFPASTSQSGTPTAAPGVINRHAIYSIVTISGAGLTIGSIVTFRVFRQNGGTDTFTGNAFLHSVGIHYQSDTLGSRSISTK